MTNVQHAVKLNAAAEPKDKMTEEELLAQLSILVLTGEFNANECQSNNAYA